MYRERYCAPLPASAIRRRAGASRVAALPRSRGIRTSSAFASALSSSIRRGRPSASSASTTSAAQRTADQRIADQRISGSADQGRITCDQVDAAVMPHLRRQRRPPPAPRPRVQSGQFHSGRRRSPKTAEPWSLTSLREKLIKIGAKLVSHGRCVAVPVGRGRGAATDVREILSLIVPASGRPPRAGMTSAGGQMRTKEAAEARPTMPAEQHVSASRRGQLAVLTACRARGARFAVDQRRPLGRS